MLHAADRVFVSCCFAFVMLVAGTSVASAQTADQNKIPEPVNEAVKTRDGTNIALTYFKGPKGKESTPVILLHEHKKTRQDMEPLAKSLQELIGASVVVPDLRGHGESTLSGTGKKIDAALFRKADDYAPMVTEDMEAILLFLLKRNNAGELNIDKLTIVGTQMGASIGASWGQADWAKRPFLQGPQGQFTKCLVLISPQLSYNNINLAAAVNQPSVAPGKVGVYRTSVAVMVVAGGGDSKAKQEANAVAKIFSRGRPKEEVDSDDVKKLTVLERLEETKLQSTALLGAAKDLNLDRAIAAFIQIHCVDKPFTYEIRKDATGQPFQP